LEAEAVELADNSALFGTVRLQGEVFDGPFHDPILDHGNAEILFGAAGCVPDRPAARTGPSEAKRSTVGCLLPLADEPKAAELAPEEKATS
jgi:hypothetical protein